MARKLDFPVFDADNHMYESMDAFTKFLPPEYDGLIKYVNVNGRIKIAIRNVISEYIPNPTFNKVAPPGAQELEFKLKNPDSMTAADKAAQLAAPPKYIESIPAYFEPEARVQLMDELGIDRAMMWPTLASLLEERLTDDPEASHVAIHALNQWMHEQWSFNFDERIFATPVITLPIVGKAIEELEWVIERGARAILIRPAPVPDFGPRRRSFALPEFDPFWDIVQEADLVVGLHASDSGFQRYVNEWEGHVGEFLPFSKPTAFYEMLHAENRTINDVITSVVGHGLVTRFPRLKVMPIENGSAWVRPLLARFERVYRRDPDVFPENPLEAFKRCIYVHPFHEEDPIGLIELIGADNVLFGSDYPHPEGMYDPVSFVDQLEGLSHDEQAKVMGGNLTRLMNVAA
jgi:predicted TIM-barrel fold metal-dependent hydrolase